MKALKAAGGTRHLGICRRVRVLSPLSLSQSLAVLAKLVYIQLTKLLRRFGNFVTVARNMGELRPRKKAAFTSGSVGAIAHIPR